MLPNVELRHSGDDCLINAAFDAVVVAVARYLTLPKDKQMKNFDEKEVSETGFVSYTLIPFWPLRLNGRILSIVFLKK